MSDISRRDALRRLALVLTATGTLDRIAAAEVHQIAAASQSSGGAYAPKSMTDAHFKTIDPFEPYSVDLEVEHEPSCPGSGVQKEITLFPDFRWDSLEFDLREATISATGRCNAVEPTITRE